jgi:hypothetical protein
MMPPQCFISLLIVASAICCIRYLAQIEEGTRSADCNAGHEAIRDFERYFKVVVLTQNIDSFHTRAGSSDVIDIHGDLNNASLFDHISTLPAHPFLLKFPS